jgi:hypothetical protein
MRDLPTPARLSRQQHDAALCRLGLFPAAQQERSLVVAADERRACCSQRLEAALGGFGGQHLPCPHVAFEAF